jgi:hypothetical protein
MYHKSYMDFVATQLLGVYVLQLHSCFTRDYKSDQRNSVEPLVILFTNWPRVGNLDATARRVGDKAKNLRILPKVGAVAYIEGLVRKDCSSY